MSESSSRVRHLVPLIVVQGVGLVCGLIGVRWSSNVVSPELLGSFGLLLGTQLFAVTVTHQGLLKHVQRYWTRHTRATPYLLHLAGASGIPTLATAMGLGVLLLGFRWTEGRLATPFWWGWMLLVNLLVVLAHGAHAALQAEERYWAHCFVSAIGSLTRSFLPLLMVMSAGASLAALSGGYLLHVMLWVGAGYWCLRASWQRPAVPQTEDVDPPARLVGAFMGVGLCGWLAGTSPRWFAALAVNAENTGYFMLALNLSMIISTAVSLIGQSYSLPVLFAARRAGAEVKMLLRLSHRDALVALVVGQAGLLILACISPWFVGTLVNPRYTPSLSWLLAAGGATLASVSSAFYCNLLLAVNREKACLILTLASAALRLGLMAALAWSGNVEAFRFGLAILAWPTVLLEYVLTRELLLRPR